MKEATGEVSMTVVTLVAIAVIGAILATQWDSIKNKIVLESAKTFAQGPDIFFFYKI